MTNHCLKIFEICFNAIGGMNTSFITLGTMKIISKFFKLNKSLLHLDLSHCGISTKDT